MSHFEPIAIVAQACVLPGALSPDALWNRITDKACAITSPPPGVFGLTDQEQGVLPYVSGFVRNFETVFDPQRFNLGEINPANLDPVCAWPLHAAIEAWTQAGTPNAAPDKIGVILANLSYPSRAHTAYAADIWTQGQSQHPAHSVFNSGFPAQLIARAIGATGPTLALDAACASSLYALETACRKLQSRQLDAALVAGVNAADNLILHIGFEALKALSPSGQSRPFIQGADGLIPSEGAAAVVLKRLSDVTPTDTVHGVIRAIGLSNDGRRRGMLVPDADGQVEAMMRAYTDANVNPSSIDFLECHATGTPTGDGVEVQASATVFGGAKALPVGSLKANTGHLITVAGLASLLKLTMAMAHETLPAMPLDGPLIDAFSGTALTPLGKARTWKQGKTPRRAAISNFGFGGNNAHLILEQYRPETTQVQVLSPPIMDDIVICGAGVLAGDDRGERAILRRLMNQPLMPSQACSEIGADALSARTPPNDLASAEPQQLAMLSTVEEALCNVAPTTPETTGIFTGMGCAADSARWLLRERAAKYFGLCPGSSAWGEAQDAIAPPLTSGAVLGAMANMNANRVTFAKDFRGSGFSVSAEGASSLAALDLACDALHSGKLDMAIVAAADFANEPVRQAALQTHSPDMITGDIAAAIVLKRRKDAETAGDTILGTLDPVDWHATSDPSEPSLIDRAYGHAPVASPLFALATHALLSARGQTLTPNGAIPDLSGVSPTATFGVSPSPLQDRGAVTFTPGPARPGSDPLRPPPHLFWAAANTKALLGTRLAQTKPGGRGKCRIAILADNQSQAAERLAAARQTLAQDQTPNGSGITYGEGTAKGEMAFVFTGSAAVYPRMARGLFMAFPEIAVQLANVDRAPEIAALLTKSSLSEFEQLCAGTLVSQAHAILLRDVLGLIPDAAIGLSLGESNALFAFGFWSDPGKLLAEIEDAAMYERHLGGSFETAGQAWGPNVPVDWSNWRLQAPLKAVRAAIAKAANVEITIIYSDQNCMIGGPSEACREVCDRLGPGVGAKMHQHLIVHAEAMKPFAETWRALHTRKVTPVPGIRLYANATNAAYTPTKARVADMLTRQAVATVDFPATIRQAWQDGVRSFVELGPRDTLTASIAEILDDKPHSAVATDRIETSDLGQVAILAATLFAQGRKINIKLIAERLDLARQHTWLAPPRQTVTRPVPYTPPITPELAPISQTAQMPLAPPLPNPVYEATPARASSDKSVRFPPPPDGYAAPSKVNSGAVALPTRSPTGPAWNRASIAASTRGLMSDLFGKAFTPQDKYTRQVRLPAPPLLLVDRITGIDAQAQVESHGVIWTESDLKPGDWFIHEGRIRPGMLIESGQADLTLIGWMGADLKNQSERVYRLLGCEITFHEGGLPAPGDTLRFQIEITGHATLAGVRMFFFQYDCHVGERAIFSVRNGQAGFFTDDELASGKGVVWDAAKDAPLIANPTAFTPSRASQKHSFSAADLDALRNGDGWTCFGEGFEYCATHSRPYKLPGDRLALIEEVTEFDPSGGLWQRGYLKARTTAATDAWFYEGHFHNDPCMPGTLMAEAAVQALEFYAAAIGLTIERDGYVFEPLPGHSAQFVCRGQVIPDQAHEITYEVFIDEIIDGETPILRASLLARADGHKIFHCPSFGIRLRRDWPVPRLSDSPIRVGPTKESRGNHAALLDCANGAPSAAFGAMYAPFDTAGNAPRLPQPPYHMMTRVIDVSTRPNAKENGARVVAEYDVPAKAWYFKNNKGTMPFAVLSEIVLQPCGWLASHCGFALDGGERFRNLGGEGHVHCEITPDAGTLTVETTLSSFSRVGPMTIVSFELTVRFADGTKVMDLKTQFGFFPAAALASQAGLPTTDEHRALLNLPVHKISTAKINKYLAAGQLRMLDKIDHFDPEGGAHGLGLIRGQQAVDPQAWYFKAHFYQDPVQPGSLGLDALVQLLTRAALLKGLGGGMTKPHVETLAADTPVKWTYRGQVTPNKKAVTTIIEITEIDPQGNRTVITAHGSIWCDGLRIYEASPISIALRDRG